MKTKDTIVILKNIAKEHGTLIEQRVFDKAIAALEYCEKQKLTYYIEGKYFGRFEVN